MNLYGEVAEAFCAFMLDADGVSLTDRVYMARDLLCQLLVAGTQLGPADGSARPFHLAEPPADFPGIHPYDRLWRSPTPDREALPVTDAVSYCMLDVFSSLMPGVEAWQSGDFDTADRYFRWANEVQAGPRAADAIPRLQLAVQHINADRRPRKRGYRTADDLTFIAERAPVERGVVGVRVSPGGGGAEVLAVHPAVPAAQLLFPGDLLLEVEGISLDGLDEAGVGAALSGPVGKPRRCLVFRDGESITVDLLPVSPSALSGRE